MLFHNLLFHFLPALFHFISSLELYHNYFIFLLGLFHSFAKAYFISFLAIPICLVMMGSKYKTCDLLFASIYIFIAQLIYIMASDTNKYKDQKPGAE